MPLAWDIDSELEDVQHVISFQRLELWWLSGAQAFSFEVIEGASCFADPSCWRGGHVAEEQLLHEQAGVLACCEAWTEHDNTMQHVPSPSSAMIGTGGAIQILARVLKEVPWHKMRIGRFRVSAKLQNLTLLALAQENCYCWSFSPFLGPLW